MQSSNIVAECNGIWDNFIHIDMLILLIDKAQGNFGCRDRTDLLATEPTGSASGKDIINPIEPGSQKKFDKYLPGMLLKNNEIELICMSIVGRMVLM